MKGKTMYHYPWRESIGSILFGLGVLSFFGTCAYGLWLAIPWSAWPWPAWTLFGGFCTIILGAFIMEA